MQQLSRDKFDRFPRATTEFTLCVLDRYGLRDHSPARPTLTPQIRFLYIGSRFCSTLPSDPYLTVTPLRFAITSPPSGCEEDFHLQAVERARRTKRNSGRMLPLSAKSKFFLGKSPSVDRTRIKTE